MKECDLKKTCKINTLLHAQTPPRNKFQGSKPKSAKAD
jgi:hypothetical protein